MTLKTVNYKRVFLLITIIICLSILLGCSLLTRELQVNTVCPPYPPGGIGVGEELERIPFNGWPALEATGTKVDRMCQAGNVDACEIDKELKELFAWMKPSEGFEHLYGWLARIKILANQLERCKSD